MGVLVKVDDVIDVVVDEVNEEVGSSEDCSSRGDADCEVALKKACAVPKEVYFDL